MDCHEIQKLLDEYSENELSKDLSAIVKKHVASCKDCSTELASLKKYKKEMASLKQAKAPADFLEQMNERIDKQSGFRKIARILFFPLKIKVPVEVLGVAAVALLIIIFIYPADQINKSMNVAEKFDFKDSSGVMDKKTDLAVVERSLQTEIRKKEPSVAAVSKDEQTFAKAGKTRQAIHAELAVYRLALSTVRYENARIDDSVRSAPHPASPAELDEASNVFKADRFSKDKAAGAPIDMEKSREAAESVTIAQAKKEQQSEALKPKAESETQEMNADATIAEIRKAVLEMKGKIIKQELDRKHPDQYIIVEIPVQHQKYFLNRISSFGNLSQEKTPSYKNNKTGNVRLKVKIDYIK
ncbi:MAG: DUF2275 domain-containing protein [Spirochaetota bacterium]